MAESASLVNAARQGAEEGATQGAMFAGGSDAIVQTAIWLLVIVGLILLLAWGVRRFTNIGPKSAGAMRVLSALPVGNRERIALVQVGDKQLLIGVAPGHVSTLHVFEDNVAVQATAAPYARPGETPARGFGQVLRNTLRSTGSPDGRESH
ncbi:MAG: flagellar biosynthetic protein FliO [Gammaproteobacteria bacterium]|nr:flagellar biosynthetic protein FliO [Gammaproteobacteria bacterium]